MSSTLPGMGRERIVDALVVAYHGDRWLDACVAFMRGDEEQGVRVVIGDNYGNSVVSSLVDGRRIFSVALPGPLGFAEANNQALMRIGLDARYICFLNQDTKSPRRWLTRAAAFLDQRVDIGAISPLLSTYDGKEWDHSFVACAGPMLTFEDIARARARSEFHEVPVIPAAAMVVRSEVLKQVGGFDPIFGSYYEDYDLCHRIRRAGYKVGIWINETVAHHSGSATTTAEAESQRQRMIVRNRLIYRVRTAECGRVRQLGRECLVELPRQLGRRMLRRPASKPVDVILGGYLDAARNVRRLVSATYDEFKWREYLDDIGWTVNGVGSQIVEQRFL